jgi:hypothetical protein
MIAMELEGVTDVRPVGEDFRYLFNVRAARFQMHRHSSY